jgi:hypothetical protein
MICQIHFKLVCQIILMTLRVGLALSSNCSILIEILLAGKAGRENDLSIAPKATMKNEKNVFSLDYHKLIFNHLICSL